jgi:hypothetical protein
MKSLKLQNCRLQYQQEHYHMNICYAVGHRWVRSLYCQCVTYILWVLIIFWYEYVQNFFYSVDGSCWFLWNTFLSDYKPSHPWRLIFIITSVRTSYGTIACGCIKREFLDKLIKKKIHDTTTHLVLGLLGSRTCTTMNAWRKCEAIISGENGVFDSWNTIATMSLPRKQTQL